MTYDYETVIITVMNREYKISSDMEVPADISINTMKAKILEILKNLYPGQFLKWDKCRLICENRFLNDADILSNTDIYDGSCLYIVRA